MAKRKSYKPANLKQVKTHSVKDRQTKVSLQHFASLPDPDATMSEFLSSLPDMLAASGLKLLIKDIISARKKNRPVVAAVVNLTSL